MLKQVGCITWVEETAANVSNLTQQVGRVYQTITTGCWLRGGSNFSVFGPRAHPL